ncbi:MAG TPA: class I SAM-dependent methyltransferase [Rhizomicrobium sp.]
MTLAYRLPAIPPSVPEPAQSIANAYDRAGYRYGLYADGDVRKIFAFDGKYAYGDRKTWDAIEIALRSLRASGKETLTVLDLGCGPGTWLRRTVTRARQMGFSSVEAVGLDIAAAQLQRARVHARALSEQPGVALRFDLGDLCGPISAADRSIDLCLCLNGVLNHVPPASLPSVFAEIARVTSGWFLATVRSVGSTPTVYIDEVSAARRFHQDNRENRMEVEFHNGSRVAFNSHLFARRELQSLAQRHFELDDIRGLDLFHGRFAADPRWNPESGAPTSHFEEQLERLENRYCRDPGFMDHATHLLLAARAMEVKAA